MELHYTAVLMALVLQLDVFLHYAFKDKMYTKKYTYV